MEGNHFLFVTYTIMQSEQLGFGALPKGLTSVVDNSCRSRDSNPQPRITSPTLYPLGHDCPFNAVNINSGSALSSLYAKLTYWYYIFYGRASAKSVAAML